MTKTETEKGPEGPSPWIWKAAIVALPTGLLISTVVAVFLKVNRGPENAMLNLNYLATELNVVSLRDAADKAENLIGARDFSSPEGQTGMRRMLSFVEGSLGSNNLGYEVMSDEGEARSGRLWKNYWIDHSPIGSGEPVVVWCSYADEQDTATVTALLGLAEWLRGRNFARPIRIAFVRDAAGAAQVMGEFAEKKEVTEFRVTNLGRGSRGLSRTEELSEQGPSRTWVRLQGDQGGTTGSDWKLTGAWEDFERQVIELCEVVGKEARQQYGAASPKK